MPPLSSEQAHHVMEFVTTHESGADELYCPICGRRVLLHWPPDLTKTILVPGDESAIHSGGKGGVAMNTPLLSQGEKFDQASIEDLRLAPWKDWMDQAGFDNLWS